MFSTSSILLRPIRDHEYEAIQQLYASCFPEVQSMEAKAQRWLSIETVTDDVKTGTGSVIVVEKKATGEVLGFAWYSTVAGRNYMKVPTTSPQNNASKSYESLTKMESDWKTELLGTYAKFICSSKSWSAFTLRLPSLFDRHRDRRIRRSTRTSASRSGPHASLPYR
jgi:hypothetical protein